MKKKSTIAGVVICLSVGCVWLTPRLHSRREPTYGGKPVSYWARQSRHAVEDDSVRVLRQMGSIAVPCLTNQLNHIFTKRCVKSQNGKSDGINSSRSPQIAAGDGHAMFLAADGQLYGWVEMILGRWVMALGVGALGGLKRDNSLWSWGQNDSGQLGDGTFTHRNKTCAGWVRE